MCSIAYPHHNVGVSWFLSCYLEQDDIICTSNARTNTDVYWYQFICIIAPQSRLTLYPLAYHDITVGFGHNMIRVSGWYPLMWLRRHVMQFDILSVLLIRIVSIGWRASSAYVEYDLRV